MACLHSVFCRVSAFTIALMVCSRCAAVDMSAADPVQKAVSDWSKVRAETIRLESQWEWERELLASTLSALQERKHTLEDKKTTLLANTAGERANLAEMNAKNEAADTALKVASERLKAISQQLIALKKLLPPRLAQALELPLKSLESNTLPPAERMQFVTTVLNRCEQFNRTVTYSEEIVSLPNEKDPKLVEVLYWGLSHAYALDRGSAKAYLGTPTHDGWSWTEKAESQKAVAQLIAIERDKADPNFVEVPVRLSSPFKN